MAQVLVARCNRNLFLMQGETTKPPIKMQFNPLIPELIFFQIPICIQGTADV